MGNPTGAPPALGLPRRPFSSRLRYDGSAAHAWASSSWVTSSSRRSSRSVWPNDVTATLPGALPSVPRGTSPRACAVEPVVPVRSGHRARMACRCGGACARAGRRSRSAGVRRGIRAAPLRSAETKERGGARRACGAASQAPDQRRSRSSPMPSWRASNTRSKAKGETTLSCNAGMA